MNNVDDLVEHLIYEVLLRAGVLPTDRAAGVLRRYVVQAYFRQLAKDPDLSRRELLIVLTEAATAVHLHVGLASRQHEGAQVRRDLAIWTHLTQNERDVLYLLQAVGLSAPQILEKLGASGDWVEVTISKLESLYERPLMKVQSRGANK
ncbi:hypothetical protein [Lacticaseibacillus porcinae]|uniref:hypothetical protein n=1 Tax=Lacticaseibacillus porcinae TaxID=1123687 RepID=UPI000F778121|nr:hypothetical protein [Lacticaseibacillus porcinae]